MPTKKPGQYWTETWNPVSGCTKVSAGCQNCFAEEMARRFPQAHGWHSVDICPSVLGPRTAHVPAPFSKILCHPDRLDIPLHWRKPRVVLVPSMGDLFHPQVPDDFRDSVFGVMGAAQSHTFQVLTKRIEVAATYLKFPRYHRQAEAVGRLVPRDLRDADGLHAWVRRNPWPFPNVYLGVSVEDQATADERIPILLDTPAAHRWVSVEPALSWIDFHCSLDKADAVIWGCESGPRRRPAPHDWARHIRSQCQPQKVPFFLKQMGANEDGTGKVVKMPELDGRVWDQLPEGMSR